MDKIHLINAFRSLINASEDKKANDNIKDIIAKLEANQRAKIDILPSDAKPDHFTIISYSKTN